MSAQPIAEYALLSDRHSAALVHRDGSIDWLCFPRFDSPSSFGRLLGDDAGYWSVGARGAISVTRRYVERTMVLETTHTTATGTAVVVDALATGDGNRGHELGEAALHLVLRRVTCTAGEVDIEVEYVPRPEYGLVVPVLDAVEGGLRATGGADVLVVSCPSKELTVNGSSASGRFRLGDGERACFALQHSPTAAGQQARVWNESEIARRLDDTVAAWQSWSHLHQAYVGPWRDLVHHSGRVLQALSFRPTGAICAAATTSLPEVIGGDRNWDYRYAWVRDASFTIEALWVAACPDEANEFFESMTAFAAGSLEQSGDLQIMFGVGGERDLEERELLHLPGWRRSAPVRIGNGAWRQRQLDVYGELLSAVHRLSDRLFDTEGRVGPGAQRNRWDTPPGLTADTRAFLVRLADVAARRWQKKDQGIWEVRGEPRHFLYSKVMCWVALDRAIALADVLGAGDRVAYWTRTQEDIRRAILREGWSERVGASRSRSAPTTSTPRVSCWGWSDSSPPTIRGCSRPSRSPRLDSPTSAVSCTAIARPTVSTVRRARSCSAPSGSPRPSPRRAGPRGPVRCSNALRASSTTWGCSPRRSIGTLVSSWVTPRGRSATSAW